MVVTTDILTMNMRASAPTRLPMIKCPQGLSICAAADVVVTKASLDRKDADMRRVKYAPEDTSSSSSARWQTRCSKTGTVQPLLVYRHRT